MKNLATIRPASTNAVIAFVPDVGKTATINEIVIVNQTTSAATARVFFDTFGAVYDASTALVYDVTIQGNSVLVLSPISLPLTQMGSIGVQSGTASALTFIINGV